MRIRTLKLREAHKNADKVGSFCSIIWDSRAHHLVTASSSDPTILIHDSLLLSTTPKSARHHYEGVTALALSPNSTCLASSSKDRSVKLYKFPGGEFETNITRFTLPIRAIAFNSSGSTLAAAGDDEGIKLINAIDGSIARVLKGHNGSVTGLAFDPNGEYMASVDSIGTVILWELNSGKALHVLTSVAPNIGSNVSISNVISWSPDGEMLAVPGLRNDVVMYDRDTAEKLFTLRGDHLELICFISWSLNGKYIASSSLDKQVLVWDVEQRQDIDKQRFDDVICSMAWKPIGNSLAVIDVKGRYCVWEAPVPSSMKSPTEDLPSSLKNNNGLLLFDEEINEPNVSGSSNDIGKGSNGDSDPPARKRLKKQLNYDDELSDGNIDPKPKSTVKRGNGVSPTDRENTATSKERNEATSLSAKSIMQEAFQPGSTPKQTGKRHFLCYNMIGSITSLEYDGYCHIEIDFHDTGRGPRVPAMTDYFGFTMASMNENGSVFANPCKGEKNMSTLMYRPFSSWANNSEWSMRFEEEEVKAVALGSGWVAAVTSFNYLRIFTEGGLQKHVISLNGPVVTTTGINDKLAIVTHASTSLPSNEQVLEFQVLNICDKTVMFRGRLPLTPGSKLTWLGFSEGGGLSSHDSKGVLRVYSNQFGGTWLPLFSANRVAKSGENYWVVGADDSKLFCVACQSPDLFPQVLPKPVLSLLDFSFPLPSSDLGAEALENEFIMKNMLLSLIHEKIENLVAAGTDTAAADDEAFNVEAALDRCILRLIASCCNGDKLVRATELVRFLSLEKSIRGAIKLATALKLPNLAERFNDILEERLFRDSTICEAVPHEIPGCDISTKADVHNKSMSSTENSKTLGRLPPSSTPKLTSPPSVKKRSAPEGDAMEAKQSQNGALDRSEGKRIEKAKNPCEGGNEETKKPSNPFAKSSTNCDKSSLFESIKKMKGADSAEKK